MCLLVWCHETKVSIKLFRLETGFASVGSGGGPVDASRNVRKSLQQMLVLYGRHLTREYSGEPIPIYNFPGCTRYFLVLQGNRTDHGRCIQVQRVLALYACTTRQHSSLLRMLVVIIGRNSDGSFACIITTPCELFYLKSRSILRYVPFR